MHITFSYISKNTPPYELPIQLQWAIKVNILDINIPPDFCNHLLSLAEFAV